MHVPTKFEVQSKVPAPHFLIQSRQNCQTMVTRNQQQHSATSAIPKKRSILAGIKKKGQSKLSQQRVLDQEDDTSDDCEDSSGDEANADNNNGTVNLHSFRVETIAHLFYDLF